MIVIEVNNLSFSYKNHDVLRNISFRLESSEICSILGPNGIGKTSLVNCLLGLNKIKSGSVLLDGKDINKINKKEYFSIVSYVKQGGKETSIYTTLDTVLLGLANSINPLLKPKDSDIEKVDNLLKELNIYALRDKYVSQLSGGEAQMVFMARALIKNPEILILDEPESNLDYRNQLLILDVIKSLKEKGKLVIFNTHYPNHAIRFSTKTLLLGGIDKYQFGNTKDIINKKNIEDTYKIKILVGTLTDGNEQYEDIIPLYTI